MTMTSRAGGSGMSDEAWGLLSPLLYCTDRKDANCMILQKPVPEITA
jgi:hypothetical protein